MKQTAIALESRLPAVGTSIFSVMSALAAEHDAINLSQGFPNFDPDPQLSELVAKYMREGANQYAPSAGLPVLCERISESILRNYGAAYDPGTEITVTSGATEALFCAISAVVKEGEEVIVFEPAYDSYSPVIKLNGAIPIYIPLEFPSYAIDWDVVKKRISSKTRLIILNSPHNPTGQVLSAGDWDELERIIGENNIFVISDEVYEHIIFEGQQHASVARHPELARRSFVVSSFGKSFHTTGWKVGYCAAPAALTKEFRKIHQFVTFSTSRPFQHAIADYMESPDCFSGLGAFYQEKRDFFRKCVEGSRFKVLDCYGTYFQLLSYEGISDLGDEAFARELTVKHKLASIPVSVFYHDGEDRKVLRFCFAKDNETMAKAGEILRKI